MSNLRIVSDNAVKRATLSASSQAGSLTVDRLKASRKTSAWRSVGTTATLTVTLPTAESFDCVALPFCNLSSTATMRIRGYATTSATTPVFDTGHKACCPYSPFEALDWGAEPLGVNAFSYGAAACAVVWFPLGLAQKLVIDITDATNDSGYIEGSCLLAGLSWSPKVNMGWGASVAVQDTTKNERSESGNLRSDKGVSSRKLSFDLKFMDPNDRNRLWRIFLGNGMSVPSFISLYPESDDAFEEQIHQMYGKLSQQSKIAAQSFGTSQAPFEVEEI